MDEGFMRQPTRDIDPNHQRGTTKIIGYPKGEHSMFLDGRLLQSVISGFQNTRPAIPPGGLVQAGPLLINRVLPIDRAMYIPWVGIFLLTDARLNMNTEWQMWANGKRVAGGALSMSPQPVHLYFPMFSEVSLYWQVSNLTIPPLPLFPHFTVPWYEFDTEADHWEMGEADRKANPPVVSITWPTL